MAPISDDGILLHRGVGMNQRELEDKYRQLSTARLIALTTVERTQYEPEAIEIAETELARRSQSAPTVTPGTSPSSSVLPFVADATCKKARSGGVIGGVIIVPGAVYYFESKPIQFGKALGKGLLLGLATAVAFGSPQAGAGVAGYHSSETRSGRDWLEGWLVEQGLLVASESPAQTKQRLDSSMQTPTSLQPLGTATSFSLLHRIEASAEVRFAIPEPGVFTLLVGSLSHTFRLRDPAVQSAAAEALIAAGFPGVVARTI